MVNSIGPEDEMMRRITRARKKGRDEGRAEVLNWLRTSLLAWGDNPSDDGGRCAPHGRPLRDCRICARYPSNEEGVERDNDYPIQWGACIMCGAEQGEPCVVISGTGEPGDEAGDHRRQPHANRTRPEQIGTAYDPSREGSFIPVKDEPPHV